MTAPERRAEGIDGDDLAFIREVVEATRDATRLAGVYYLLWGALIGAGLLVTWAVVSGFLSIGSATLWWAWGAISLSGWIATAVLIGRERAMALAVGRAARQMGMIWAGFGLVAALIYFIGAGTGTVPAAPLAGLMAVTLGLAIWAVGLAGAVPWFRNLAFAWWAGGAAMLAWPGAHVLPMLAAMVWLLFALPGWWLARKARART